MNLSEEQKRKIEANRRRAVELRLKRTSSAEIKSGPGIQSVAKDPEKPKFGVYKSFKEMSAPPSSSFNSGPSTSASASAYSGRKTTLLDYVPNQNRVAAKPTVQPLPQALGKPAQAKTHPNPKDRRQWGPATKKAESLSKRVVIHLCSPEKIEATSPFHQGVIEVFKGLSSRNYDPMTKKWKFSIKEHDLLVHRLETIPGISVEKLPKKVLEIFLARLRDGQAAIPEIDLSVVDKKLTAALMPFQREGVNFGIAHGGRLLLADDMGLGKTIQALCLAAFFRSQWPLLIVAPSSVRYAWRDQILRWLPSVSVAEVRVVDSSKEFRERDLSSALILITSYELLSKNAQDLSNRRFKVVIMDECHFLKNAKAARTKAAMPLLHAARHVFLLSGTPALSRPCELYTQVTAVMPNLFRSYHDFCLRYCDGKELAWGWDYSGCSNMDELQLLLEQKVMIRRTKEQVLTQLPEKRREMFILDPSSVKKSSLDRTAKAMLQGGMKSMERRGALLEYFHETAKAKLPAIRQYILDLLEASGRKFLVFAHHQEVLDSLTELLDSKEKDHIRIDGRTPADRRRSEVERFQLYPDVQVALLSITAASSGINLTAASLVVFVELFWNPGILVQAEDRVYRIGQRNCVSVQYLVASGTADDYVWPLVQEKLEVLSKAGLNRESFRDADTTQLGQRDATILDYFRTDFLEVEKDDAKPDNKSASSLFQFETERPEERKPDSDDIVIVPESPDAYCEQLSDWEEGERGEEEEKTLVNQTVVEEEEEEDFDSVMANIACELEKEELRKTENFDWMTEDDNWSQEKTVTAEAVVETEDLSWIVDDDEEEGWCKAPVAKRHCVDQTT